MTKFDFLSHITAYKAGLEREVERLTGLIQACETIIASDKLLSTLREDRNETVVPRPANRSRKAKELAKRVCRNPKCEILFTPKRGNQRYHSPGCMFSSQKDRYLASVAQKDEPPMGKSTNEIAAAVVAEATETAIPKRTSSTGGGKWPEDKLEAFKRWARLEAVSRYKKQPYWEQLNPAVPRIALKSAYEIPYDGSDDCEEKLKGAFLANLEIFIENEIDKEEDDD